MISNELKEAWRLAVREALEKSSIIKNMQPTLPPTNIGTRQARNPVSMSQRGPLEIQKNRISTRITNLVGEFGLSDRDIIGADLNPNSKTPFVKRLIAESESDERPPRPIISKALLLGLASVQNTYK